MSHVDVFAENYETNENRVEKTKEDAKMHVFDDDDEVVDVVIGKGIGLEEIVVVDSGGCEANGDFLKVLIDESDILEERCELVDDVGRNEVIESIEVWQFEDKDVGIDEERVKVELIGVKDVQGADSVGSFVENAAVAEEIEENVVGVGSLQKEQEKKKLWDEYYQYKTNSIQKNAQKTKDQLVPVSDKIDEAMKSDDIDEHQLMKINVAQTKTFKERYKDFLELIELQEKNKMEAKQKQLQALLSNFISDLVSLETDYKYLNLELYQNEEEINETSRIIESKEVTEEKLRGSSFCVKLQEDAEISKCELSCEKKVKFEDYYDDLMNQTDIVCEICGTVSNKWMTHQLHWSKHTSQPPFPCKLCAKQFSSFQYLRNHFNYTHVEAYYNCNSCELGFHFEGNYRKHMEAHETPSKSFCNVCEVYFPSDDALKKHYVTRHPIKKKKHLITRQQCEICGKIFKSAALLNCHLQQHTKNFLYSCEICKRGFATRQRLKEHSGIHSNLKPYICEECGRPFRLRHLLMKHTREIHLNMRPYACCFCSFRSCSKRGRDIHMNLHTGARPYVCKLCNAAFPSDVSLSRHRQKHKPQQKVTCTQCNKVYASKESLMQHKIVHLGIKMHQCHICARRYARLATLNKHLRKHAENTPETSNKLKTMRET